MQRRSTNETVGYTHFAGDLTAQVDSSHGVRLTGGSTGGIVEAVGDDTNVSLTIRAQGAGNLIIGSSGQAAFTGGSTAPFAGFLRTLRSSFATPNFNTTNAMVMETTHVITGLTTSSFVLANPQSNANPSTDMVLVGAYPSRSTAGDVHCLLAKHSTLTVAATSGSLQFLVMRF